MTIWGIALKNIRHNLIHYALYLVVMIFSIVIFYTFLLFATAPTVVKQLNRSAKLSSIFDAAALILFAFLVLFIFVFSRFFLKRRKKELGLYALLGIEKWRIALLFFYENVVLSIVALVAGILCGIFFSKFFLSVLLYFMEIRIISEFAISSNVILRTCLAFLTLVVLAGIYNYWTIYKSSLLDLFRSAHKSEPIPLIKPIMAILSFIFIGLGYFLALQPREFFASEVNFSWLALSILLLTILGTILFIAYFLPYTIRFLERRKKLYYANINLIAFTKIAARTKQHTKMLASISILSAASLTIIGTLGSFYFTSNQDIHNTTPTTFTYFVQPKINEAKIKKILTSDKEHKYKGDYIYRVYYLEDPQSFYQIVSETDYIKLLKLTGKPLPKITTGFFTDFPNEIDLPLTLKINNHQLSVSNYLTENPFAYFQQYAVIPDAEITHLQGLKTELIHTYQVENGRTAFALSKKLRHELTDSNILMSYPDRYMNAKSTSGVILFIGMFLGLVFLAATGCMLYFKQLTNAFNDQPLFKSLCKLGVTDKEMKSIIAKQTFVIFFVPLSIGILHSSVALTALSHFIAMDLTLPVVVTIILYTIIYTCAYFITVNSYTKIAIKAKSC